MASWHLITPEFPPLVGGVSEHSRLLAGMAAARGLEPQVWSRTGAGPQAGVQVHDTLGTFADSDLARTGAALDRESAPRHLVLQWVPHGWGRRGLNVAFSRWVRDRVRRGDRLDVIVHEPFVDFLGGSWLQPVRAVVQRYMARTVLRSASRVWMSIPAWQPRLTSPWIGLSNGLRVLPVPGTIPVADDGAAVERLRRDLAGPARHVVGYFGTGGEYAELALARMLRGLPDRGAAFALVCLGRESDAVCARLRAAVPEFAGAATGTGTLPDEGLSRHLQACDVLVQPYVDGVSGRRTTTISGLEHGIPVATTLGRLSESFWADAGAVEAVPAASPALLANAVTTLLGEARNRTARAEARRLYESRFAPSVALAPLFES